MFNPRSLRSLLPGLLTFVALLVLTVQVTTQGQSGRGQGPDRETLNGLDVVAGEVLVKFRTPPGLAERDQLDFQLGNDRNEEVGGGINVRRLHSRVFDTLSLLAFFRAQPNVEYVEPNYIVEATAVPNDLQYPQLWGLNNTGHPGADIHAQAAWDITTGSRSNVVAVIDTGVDYTHPDLAANIWSAPSAFTVQIGGGPITCAQGTHGFNAIKKTCDPLDDNNHGTHVSGTIGAVGNNGVGVAGVNWTASIMGSKFLNAAGSGTTADAINAIEFAIQAKSAFSSGGPNVRVLSNSWGGGGFSQALLDEIKNANTNDMLFVAAAGNNGSNNNTTPSYPASYNAQNIIAVAATDSNDALASWSNYGSTSVHLGAPGVSILSTTRNNTYQYFSGTPMATPHVSGAALLVLSVCSLTTDALKNDLLQNVDLIGSLNGNTITGGRLNAFKALQACAPGQVPQLPPAPTNLNASGSNGQVSLTWTAVSGATSYNIKRGTSSGSETLLASGIQSASYTDSAVTNGTTYFYKVSAVNGAGEGPDSGEASATPTAPVGSAPSVPATVTASPGPGAKKITVSWSASANATSYIVASSSGQVLATGVTGTSWQNTGLASGTYSYKVAAVNSFGTSAYSANTTPVTLR
jgi:subtilisin family serine protease